MPAVRASSAAPPNALLLWTDGRSLYTELPGPSGPHVIRYALTVAGISSALSLIRTRAYDTVDRTLLGIDAARSGSLKQQLEARDELRKMRILP